MMHIPLLLLSVAAGYGILILAKNQTKALKTVGQLLGGLIILVALGGLICIAKCASCKRGDKAGAMCASGPMKGGCPMMGKSSAEETAPAPK